MSLRTDNGGSVSTQMFSEDSRKAMLLDEAHISSGSLSSESSVEFAVDAISSRQTVGSNLLSTVDKSSDKRNCTNKLRYGENDHERSGNEGKKKRKRIRKRYYLNWPLVVTLLLLAGGMVMIVHQCVLQH